MVLTLRVVMTGFAAQKTPVMMCYLCTSVKEAFAMQTMGSEIKDEVFVDEYVGGIIGPSLGFAGTVKDGGYIRCHA
jgi:hypothetical protein